jgi:hypothetical protein
LLIQVDGKKKKKEKKRDEHEKSLIVGLTDELASLRAHHIRSSTCFGACRY